MENVIKMKGVVSNNNASGIEISPARPFTKVNIRVSTKPGKEPVQMVDFIGADDKVIATLNASSLAYATLEATGTSVAAALALADDKETVVSLPTVGGLISSTEKDPSGLISNLESRYATLTPGQKTFLVGLQKKTTKIFQPIISGWQVGNFGVAKS
jgi:hypothetical protein